MGKKISVYFSFNSGVCEEALNFYAQVLDGEIGEIMRYGDMPSEEQDEAFSEAADLIVHSSLKVGDDEIMFADNINDDTVTGDQVTLNFVGEDEEETRRVWDQFVKAGSAVHMDLAEAFFAPLFGVLEDPYCINWQIMLG